MNKITSLAQLIEELDHCQGDDYYKIAHRLAIPKEDFYPFAQFTSESYSRICLDKNKQHELLLLCWEEGQETDIHSHDGEECWVYLAEGKIREKRFSGDPEKLEVTDDVQMKKSGVSYMNDEMGYHSLHNIESGKSMTLHLYVGPINKCEVFCEDEKDFVEKELSYDEVLVGEITN